MPHHVRAFVEEVTGAAVVDHRDETGGLSTGCATRVRCADGTRVFAVRQPLRQRDLGAHACRR